jgi:hypothetical protein
MLIEMRRCFGGARKSAEVNCEPWSEFQIFGWPN